MTPAAELSAAVLLDTLREAYTGPAWHGPAVRSALRGVHAAEALARPTASRNSIWELTLHLAYSRYLVIGRIASAGADDGARPASAPTFPRRLRTSWWPVLPPEPDERAWRADLELLEDFHRRLLDTVAGLSPATLRTRRPGARHTIAQEILGVALHDAYHAGQIRLVRRAKGKSTKYEIRNTKGASGRS